MASPSSPPPVAWIQEALRANPYAARLWIQASEEIQSPITLENDKNEVALSDADEYLQFVMGALEHAIFPRARSPVFAKSFGIANRDVARGWIAGKIRQNVMGENWIQAPNLSKIADIFARALVLMGKCRFPLYLPESQAEGWFLIWRMLSEQRMEGSGWNFVGAEEEETNLRPSIASFRRIAERSQAKARLRYLRARRMASQESDGQVWGEDSFLEEPSADESPPPAHSEFPPLTLSNALSLPLVSSDPHLTFSSLRRSGETVESGSTKER